MEKIWKGELLGRNKLGITKLKSTSKIFEAVAKVFEEALEDDGKMSIGDLFDKDVLGALADLGKVGKQTFENLDEIKAEFQDLDPLESAELLSHYLLAGIKIAQSLEAQKKHNCDMEVVTHD